MISVLVADDHAIVRSGIKLMIESQPDMKVVGEAEDGEEAVHKALELVPDIVIMDLKMPKKSGMVAIKQITEANDQIKIIVLTMHDDKEYIFRTLQAGATSYLLKSHHENDLIEAIRTVSIGEAYLYPNATKLLLEDYIQKSSSTHDDNLMKLSGREQEVLSYLAKGYTNREAAEQLFVSIKTIESHRSKIMEKLNLKTRPALVEYAAKNGFLDFS
ncbi:response regulator transcription factor [Sporosarcina sp. FSL W7-1349]|uniref:response regulator transcription factor n=1 Tax=Sporosarcina sp. FSL W7-1349 TaxID=2921561 RepID=UPI0030FC903B